MCYKSLFQPFLLTIFLLISCGTPKKQLVSEQEKPIWITKTPIDDSQYIGIGMASKKNPNFREIALKMALTEISNSISVTVSSTNQLQVFQYDNSFSDFYSMSSKIASNAFLEGYTIVDTYQNDEFYYNYITLSKQKHQEITQKRIQNAFEASKFKFNNAQNEKAKANFQEAIALKIQALELISPFLNEDLRLLHNGNNVPYASLLTQQIFDDLKAITIQVPPKKISINHTSDAEIIVPPTCIVLCNKKPLTNFPINVAFSWKSGTSEQLYSAIDGSIPLQFPRKCSENTKEAITLSPAITKWINSLSKNEIVQKIMANVQPKNYVLEVQKIIPQLAITYNGLADDAILKSFDTTLKQTFANDNFTVIKPKKTDYILNFQFNKTKSLQVNDKISVIYACQIKVMKANTTTIVYEHTLENNIGIGTSEVNAIENALESVLAAFKMNHYHEIKFSML